LASTYAEAPGFILVPPVVSCIDQSLAFGAPFQVADFQSNQDWPVGPVKVDGSLEPPVADWYMSGADDVGVKPEVAPDEVAS
jgi:hypothetical protein